MTIELHIPADLECLLRERAADTGKDVEDVVLQAVVEKLATKEPQASRSILTANEWQQKLQELIDLHPKTLIADDSRESIYAGRGE